MKATSQKMLPAHIQPLAGDHGMQLKPPIKPRNPRWASINHAGHAVKGGLPLPHAFWRLSTADAMPIASAVSADMRVRTHAQHGSTCRTSSGHMQTVILQPWVNASDLPLQILNRCTRVNPPPPSYPAFCGCGALPAWGGALFIRFLYHASL